MAAKGAALGIDRDRLAVMGDSAGANLAAVMCMTFRDKIEDDVRIAVQVLLAPWTDLAPIDSESRREYGQGYLLTNGLIEWFAGHYLGGDPRQVEEPYCSPLRAADLSGLPPAIIVTAEYDPLRDEGEAYGAMLRQDRVWTDIRRQEGMIHSFYWMGGAIDRGREIIDELAAEFRSEFRL
jgi:acetyl esterase